MDDDDSSKPVPFSAIGRSGTFIIDDADEKSEEFDSNNVVEESSQDQQRNLTETESPRNKQKITDVSVNNDEEVGNNEAKPQRTDEISRASTCNSPERVTNDGHDSSSEVPANHNKLGVPVPSPTSDQTTAAAEDQQRLQLIPVQDFARSASATLNESPAEPTEQERPVPVPAPRKSMTKLPDERVDKYLLLHKELLQKWEDIANLPKFQPFDSKTRITLQEQVDRRLITQCLPNYGDDSQTLLKSVDEALERFYNEKLFNADTSVPIGRLNDKKGKGLPSLQFLQWILPTLDKQTQTLLFSCDDLFV